MGVHQLVGHWRECQDSDISYDQCPPDKLVDTIERSYFVVRPEAVDEQEFIDLLIKLMTIDGETQDAIVYHSSKNDEIKILGADKEVYDNYRHITLGKLSQAYSQHIKKMNVPFIFEGVEIPGSNSGRSVMKMLNIKH